MVLRVNQRLGVRLVMAFSVVLGLATGAVGCTGGKTRPNEAAKEVRVAAASDLKFAMEDIAYAFEREHSNIRIKVTYGSSGNFYTQIENGAPFDMFFSADAIYPRKLTEKGLTLPNSDFIYAIGRIVLWVPRSSPIDVSKDGIDSLSHPSIHHIAIANPRHAPYGRAAEAALKALGVYEAIQDKLVYGENIAQTAQMVQSGAAEIGVIALSLAVSPTMRDQGNYWEIPLASYPRMVQGGVILKRAEEPEAAKTFRAYVLDARGRTILKRYGFFIPEETGP